MHIFKSGPVIALISALALASCGDSDPIAPEPEETEVPEEFQSAPATPPEAAAAGLGSPMAERVATIGLLNKRNNLSQDLEMKPGESRRLGDVIVRLSACERTAPWEMPKQTGAFVQVLVQDKADNTQWLRIFSGWLFKESPSLNVVEHPVYDVWIKECKMRFPGEDAPAPSPSASPAAPAPADAPSEPANDT